MFIPNCPLSPLLRLLPTSNSCTPYAAVLLNSTTDFHLILCPTVVPILVMIHTPQRISPSHANEYIHLLAIYMAHLLLAQPKCRHSPALVLTQHRCAAINIIIRDRRRCTTLRATTFTALPCLRLWTPTCLPRHLDTTRRLLKHRSTDLHRLDGRLCHLRQMALVARVPHSGWVQEWVWAPTAWVDSPKQTGWTRAAMRKFAIGNATVTATARNMTEGNVINVSAISVKGNNGNIVSATCETVSISCSNNSNSNSRRLQCTDIRIQLFLRTIITIEHTRHIITMLCITTTRNNNRRPLVRLSLRGRLESMTGR